MSNLLKKGSFFLVFISSLYLFGDEEEIKSVHLQQKIENLEELRDYYNAKAAREEDTAIRFQSGGKIVEAQRYYRLSEQSKHIEQRIEKILTEIKEQHQGNL